MYYTNTPHFYHMISSESSLFQRVAKLLIRVLIFRTVRELLIKAIGNVAVAGTSFFFIAYPIHI